MPSSIRGRPEPSALLSVAQAATVLGVHPNTIRGWSDAGRLPTYRINARGDRRFRRVEVEQLLASHRPDTPTAADQRQAELGLLADLAEGATAIGNVGSVCRSAIHAIRARLGCGRLAIYLATDAYQLVLEAHAGYATPPPAVVNQPLDDGEAAQPTAEGRRLSLPLRVGHRVVGCMMIEDEADGPLNQAYLPVLRTAASSLAVTIHHRRLIARVRRELRRTRALRSVTQELTGQLDLNEVLNDIVERTRALFEADKAGLWFVDEEIRQPFRLAAQHGIGQEYLDQVDHLTMESDTIGVRVIRERRLRTMRNADLEPSPGLAPSTYAREGIRTVCMVPLLARDRALGILGVYHCRDREWSPEELVLVQSFADQAAVAINNARLYRSVADQAARMRSIQDLSARLNRLTDARSIAEAIVAEASTLAEYHDIRVYTVDWERRVCDPIAFRGQILGEAEGLEDRLRVAVGEGLTGWVAENAEPLLINDALDDPRAKTIEGTDEVPESMLVVPMVFEEHVLGVIVLSKLGVDQFSGDDLQTMTIFAGYAAQAIANADAYQMLREQSTELARQLHSQRRLLEINERLQSSLDHGSVLEAIADGLQGVVAYDNLSIYRAVRAQRVLLPVLAREAYVEEVMGHIVPFGSGLMGWAVEYAESLLVNDALADPRAVQIPGTPAEPEAIIIVPLIADGEVIGAMNVGRIGEHDVYFSPTDFELVKLFAAQASIALRNADTHQAVSLRADTDALTGLGNHGAFQRSLSELLARGTDASDETEHRVALLMMDLDNFKAYNDQLGHPAGDALLRAAGAAIQRSARADDRVYRYGGDEFAFILPDVDSAIAVRIAERVRGAVARLTAEGSPRVTITVGVAGFPDDATDKNGLIAAADTALYYGKQAGEDRVTAAAAVPGDIRDLRGTLDALARAALRGEGETVSEMAIPVAAAAARRAAGVGGEEAVARRALLEVARALAGRDRRGRSRTERIGRLAHDVAFRLGCADDLQQSIELAARLAPISGLADASGTHRALDAVGPLRVVRQIMERGEHRPATHGNDQIALAAQVLDVVERFDAMSTGRGRRRRLTRAAALRELRTPPGRYRPEVIEALAAAVGSPLDSGRRRRRSDSRPEVAGAA